MIVKGISTYDLETKVRPFVIEQNYDPIGNIIILEDQTDENNDNVTHYIQALFKNTNPI